MKKLIEIIKKKWLRDTAKTTLLIVLLFVAFIGINMAVQKIEFQDIDVTANKLFTLSEESKKQVKGVDKKVTIHLIGFSEETALVDLAKQYTKQNGNIVCDIIEDIQDRVDLKNKYSITDETQVIIIETEENNKILTPDELYSYDYTTYQQMDLSEQKLTNAIVDLTLANKPKIYFLTGHNEYGLSTHLQVLNAYLVNEVNEVETLNLLVKDAVPEDASLLVIANPTQDFSEREVEIITNYINIGGNILWMKDAEGLGNTYPNMQKILDLYGAKINDGVILEQDSDRIALQTPNYIIPNITSTKATKDIATDGGILLMNAGRLAIADDETLETLKVTNETILTTSKQALFRTDLSNGTTTKSSSDEEGTWTVATKLTKQIEENRNSTLYVIANTLFVTDYTITVGSNQQYAIGFSNNRDYILNTIAELTNREDSISIRKDTGVVTYTATEKQDIIIKVIIFGMPTLIILAGIIIWQIRRRKK